MSQTLHITIDIGRQEVADQVLEILNGIPQVNAVATDNLLHERSPKAGLKDTDIIILDDGAGQSDMVEHIAATQNAFPETAIFVISPDHSPRNIVQLMKAGASEFISNPVKADNIIDAVEEFRVKRLNDKRKNEGKICSFISCKGGLGSSVLATNSAAALCRKKKDAIALVDMSLHAGDLSVMLDVMPSNSIADLSRNIHRLDVALLRGAVFHQQTGFDFLAAPQAPSDADKIKGDDVKKILSLNNKLYDYTLVDCPSMHVDDCTRTVMELSTVIFIVVDLSVSSIRNASRLIQHIETLGINPERIAIVINRYVKGSTLSISEVEKATKRTVFWIFPNEFAPIMSSINQGVPLVKLNPKSAFSRNIQEFVAKLKDPAVHSGYRGIRGTFGKVI